MSSEEIEQELRKEYSCVIIPIGVIEAHGPLLPVGFDAMMACLVAHVVAERIQKSGARPVIFDCVPYSGIVGATDNLLGTIPYPALLSTELLFVALQWIYAHGLRHFFLINGDAGTGKSLVPFLFRATTERQEFFRDSDSILSLFTWFDGIENVGHASIVEHAFYTYLCKHPDLHIRDIAQQLGMASPFDEERLKSLDGIQRIYPAPRQEFYSWASLPGQMASYGISRFSYKEYQKFLVSGRAHELWEQQIGRIVHDMLALLKIEEIYEYTNSDRN